MSNKYTKDFICNINALILKKAHIITLFVKQQFGSTIAQVSKLTNKFTVFTSSMREYHVKKITLQRISGENNMKSVYVNFTYL